MRRWLYRLALPVAVTAGVLVGGGSAAWADSTVNINSGNVPTTAKAQTQQCSTSTGGGPFAGTDTWVFVLPGSHSHSGDFVSLTANFDTDGNGTPDQTRVIPTTGGFLNGGPQTSKAFLPTPAGWTLISASAVITGTASFFTLSHACAASGSTPTPPPTRTPPPSTTTSTTTSATTPGTPPTTPGDDGSLPTTGVALTGVIVAGIALVAGGAALLIIRRRQDRASAG